jgi:Cu(I)/Ag(I) efflux system membrane fusion protein
MQGKKYIGLVALAITAFTACNSNQQSTETKDSTKVEATDTSVVNSLSFQDQKLQTIYAAYIKLKDQLVATKLEAAKPAATELAAALKGFEGCENAATIAGKIAEAKDIKTQRAAFTDLNVEIIPVFKHAALTSGTIYVQHCPMANNGDGGDWLASEKKIQNPYYGDEMMECGRVAEEIKAK